MKRWPARVLPWLLLALAACERFGGGPSSNPIEAAPIDTARIHSADVASWGYRREISADLDGDKKLDRLVIAANVAVGPTGPIWEDGHLWAVYVEPPSGQRTLL